MALENIKLTLQLPKPWRRQFTEKLTIRLINDYDASHLKKRATKCVDEDNPNDRAASRSSPKRGSPAKTNSLLYEMLHRVEVPGQPAAGLLAKLKYAIELDQDVNFEADDLELAWQNPMNFWGQQDKLCRIRTEAEIRCLLTALRMHQLALPDAEHTVFFYVVSQQIGPWLQ